MCGDEGVPRRSGTENRGSPNPIPAGPTRHLAFFCRSLLGVYERPLGSELGREVHLPPLEQLGDLIQPHSDARRKAFLCLTLVLGLRGKGSQHPAGSGLGCTRREGPGVCEGRTTPEWGCPEGLRASRILPGQPHLASSLLTFPLRDCREQSWGNPISTQIFQISIYCRIKNGRQPLLSRALPF